MKIRPARSVDAPAIAALLAARVVDTCYAGVDEVDVPFARKMFAYAAQRHGNTNEGGMFLMVAEDESGDVAAFCMGSLGRVYGVGKRLCATDNYLLGRAGCPPRVLVNLFDAYVQWASTNPRVIEIGASWSDAIPGSQAMEHVFERRGFIACAHTYRRKVGAA